MTGATGYVGGRLVPELLAAGHEVRTTTSHPGRELPWWGERVETVQMDGRDAAAVRAACRDMDAVYYLIHGMARTDFADADRKVAQNMATAVDEHRVSRLVYLSGVLPDVAERELSEHLSSRLEVERILSDTSATVVTLRAAVILGSGSTSFEIIRQVSERLPVQLVPAWMNSEVQPIAVVDVLAALVSALDYTGPSRHFDIGGPDRMAYADLLDVYSREADLIRPQFQVTLLPSRLVGSLIAGLTDVPPATVEALVESLSHDMVCSEDGLHQLLSEEYQPLDLATAIRRSLRERRVPAEEADPMGPLPQDPAWSGGGDEDQRPRLARALDAARSAVFGDRPAFSDESGAGPDLGPSRRRR
ncbi:epimerase [Enemella dayhoffiae]|uniref:Epimerase n=1 Tax=Enemella dayhoffiae TaxID=2016507 RepID=A0A255HCQ9_9ACTN|nr:NAD(P)H-binding protein [Enemella dayhoffiae]OYO25352.1 epimerase [Enemella dayhoffiae]